VRGVTSADVARRAGVSRATVSYVLNDAPSAIRISSETRDRVLQAVKELGYAPNRAAQNLRFQRTGILAYVHVGRLDPFSFRLMEGVQHAAQSHGFVFATFSLQSAPMFQQAIAFLGGRGADGVVTPEYEGPAYADLANLARQGLPVVTQAVSTDPAIPAIGFDLEEGGFLATSHLVELGHERIAHLGPRIQPWPWPDRYPERAAGYRRALATAGLEARPDWHIIESSSLDGGARAIRKLLALPEPRPTAVFAYNDWMALGALRALHADGVKVPDDIAVVGFDGIDIASLTFPPLTTVELPFESWGRTAMDLISSQLAGKPAPSPAFLKPSLVVRDSSVTVVG